MVQRLAIQSADAANDPDGSELIPVLQWTGAEWVPARLTVQQIADYAALGGIISIGDVTGLQDELNGKAGVFVDTTLAALQADANAINTTAKTRNKIAVDENERTWRALGILAASKWRALDDPAGIEDITPA